MMGLADQLFFIQSYLRVLTGWGQEAKLLDLFLARFLVAFCAEESCGTCPPCRIGSRAILNLLDRVGSGVAEACDLERLERLCHHVQRTSLCELGRRTASSVITGLENFRDSYESHLSGRGCPTGGCLSVDDRRRLSH